MLGWVKVKGYGEAFLESIALMYGMRIISA